MYSKTRRTITIIAVIVVLFILFGLLIQKLSAPKLPNFATSLRGLNGNYTAAIETGGEGFILDKGMASSRMAISDNEYAIYSHLGEEIESGRIEFVRNGLFLLKPNNGEDPKQAIIFDRTLVVIREDLILVYLQEGNVPVFIKQPE